MGFTYYNYLLFIPPETTCKAVDLAHFLQKKYKESSREVTVEAVGAKVVVTFDDWPFTIYINEQQHVQVEAQEIYEIYSHKTDAAWIASCKARLETSGFYDPEMRFFNEVMLILGWLEEEFKVVIFDHGEFI